MTILTELRILQLARSGALEKWHKANERLKHLPNNEITKIQERKRWKELREIEKLLLKEEKASQIKL